MKGTLHKTESGWVVKYYIMRESSHAIHPNEYTLPLIDNGHIDGLKLYDSNEGLEVEFEIVSNEGEPLGRGEQPYKQYAKFARIITPEEVRFNLSKAELKDWDVTLNDGLDNEPYITKPGFVEKRINQMLEHLASEEFKNVGDEGLFPNHTDKDIWISGFKAGYLKK